MHMKYFGDSYDLVKRSLIGWLRDFGEWYVHPMLTEKASANEVHAFERFLGARVVSTEVLTAATDREAYLACGPNDAHLFFDPNTGLMLKETKGKRAPEFLFADELEGFAASHRETLALVFDQSLPRGREAPSLEVKLKHLRSRGIHSFAYVSHASFLVAGQDRALVNRAHSHILAESKLPARRFLVSSRSPVIGR